METQVTINILSAYKFEAVRMISNSKNFDSSSDSVKNKLKAKESNNENKGDVGTWVGWGARWWFGSFSRRWSPLCTLALFSTLSFSSFPYASFLYLFGLQFNTIQCIHYNTRRSFQTQVANLELLIGLNALKSDRHYC